MFASRDEIYEEVRRTLHELFELEPERIHPGAHLYKELDIDSIDAVDLIVHLQNLTNKRIKPDDFKSVRTVDDVVSAVETLMKS